MSLQHVVNLIPPLTFNTVFYLVSLFNTLSFSVLFYECFIKLCIHQFKQHHSLLLMIFFYLHIFLYTYILFILHFYCYLYFYFKVTKQQYNVNETTTAIWGLRRKGRKLEGNQESYSIMLNLFRFSYKCLLTVTVKLHTVLQLCKFSTAPCLLPNIMVLS